MKGSRIVLALCLGASAWAQQVLPQKPVASPAAPAKRVPARTGMQPSALPPSQIMKTSAGKAAKPKKAYKAHSRDTRKTAGAGEPEVNIAGKRRDPFVSPILERSAHLGPVCTGAGRRCLSVREISLHGVVRTSSGYIAVVTNEDRTYFLRVHDPLADGVVEQITADTITLREQSTDLLGRRFTRQVTKKIGAPAV